MPPRHGSLAVFKITDAGATLRDLSTYLTEAPLELSQDTAEVTTLGAAAKVYIPGLADGTFSLNGIFDVTVDGWLAGLVSVSLAARAYEYYPGGNVTGQPKFVGTAILTKYNPAAQVDDAVKFSAEFQNSGAITRTLVP